jgi:hypothetical protein
MHAIKYIVVFFLLSTARLVTAQNISIGRFFNSHSKSHLYYVYLGDTAAYVFRMGQYLDKAGTGYSINHTDTLTRQIDGSFIGKTSKVINEGNTCYLVVQERKVKKFVIDSSAGITTIHTNLNNGYYLGHYFKLQIAYI